MYHITRQLSACHQKHFHHISEFTPEARDVSFGGGKASERNIHLDWISVTLYPMLCTVRLHGAAQRPSKLVMLLLLLVWHLPVTTAYTHRCQLQIDGITKVCSAWLSTWNASARKSSRWCMLHCVPTKVMQARLQPLSSPSAPRPDHSRAQEVFCAWCGFVLSTAVACFCDVTLQHADNWLDLPEGRCTSRQQRL